MKILPHADQYGYAKYFNLNIIWGRESTKLRLYLIKEIEEIYSFNFGSLKQFTIRLHLKDLP